MMASTDMGAPVQLPKKKPEQTNNVKKDSVKSDNRKKSVSFSAITPYKEV